MNHICYTVAYIIFIPIVPEFRFQQPMYSANETDGFVEVCVVTSSVLERTVPVTVETLSGTATGEEWCSYAAIHDIV